MAERTADFVDVTPVVSNMEMDVVAPQRDTAVELLSEWLARPVKIDSGTWAASDGSTGFSIDAYNPWTEWMSNAAVANKLVNYQLMRGVLHLRIVLNGSPFHQGLISFKYLPFQENNLLSSYSTLQHAIQLPGVIMNVSTDTNAEFVLPFYSQRNWIDLSPQGASGYVPTEQGKNLGQLKIIPLTTLAHVTEATPPEVGYTVYAWMEHLELAVPTPYPLLTEAGFKATTKPVENPVSTGPLSGPATTIATIASRLTDVPFIGTFAKATEIGASAVSSVAKLFGFSKPSLLDNLGLMKIGIFPNQSAGVGYDTANKLSLDPRQETSVNPNANGFREEDAMSIAHIASRDGFVTKYSWTYSDAADTVLAQLPVSPAGYLVSQTTGLFTRIDPTPLFWLTRAFMYWSGSLIFTFKFASTRFHRGRLQIAFLPRDAAVLPTTDWTNVTWNTIVDINENNEVEIEVPWTQAYGWLSTKRILWSDTSFSYPEANGTLVLRVINPLEASSTTASVDIVVTVRAGEDFKVNKPYSQAIQNYYSWFTGWTLFPGVQNSFQDNLYTAPVNDTYAYDSTTDAAPAITEAGFIQVESNENTDVVNFGESIASIRTLIKRYVPYLSFNSDADQKARSGFTLPAHPFDVRKLFSTFPPPPGNTLNPNWYSNGQTFYTYFRDGFVGVRGGSRYRVAMGETSKGGLTTVVNNSALYPNMVTLTDAAAPFVNEFHKFENIQYGQGNGCALSLSNVNGGIEFEVPYYSPLNFVLGSALDDRYGSASYGAVLSTNNAFVHFPGPHTQTTGATFQPAVNAQVYHAGAEDASFEWFFAAPSLYRPILDNTVGRDTNST